MSTKTVHVRIEGRVQGVWFRAWTVKEARGRSLQGWVRNRLDGSVEALFSGPVEAIEEMLAACRQGPPAARVSSVQRLPLGDEEIPDLGFEQRSTA